MGEKDGGLDAAEAPGWESIDEALRPIYGDQAPLHWGTIIGYRIGGPDPLDGISAYARNEPVPHWHYVTYGFSELYEKESEDQETSGFGFELTFRLGRDQEEETPPNWPLNFLNNLARYVFESGNPFGDGHHMHLNGPIAFDTDTRIRAIAFRKDPELAPVASPNGRLEFLQIVGLTDDEYEACLRWNTESFLNRAIDRLPILTTDIGRRSLLDNPTFAEIVAQGIETEGSSTAVFYSNNIGWRSRRGLLGRRLIVSMDVNTARKAALMIPSRLPFNREFSLVSDSAAITLRSGGEPKWELVESDHLMVDLPQGFIAEVCNGLGRGSGKVMLGGSSKMEFEITPTEIKDADGNVVETLE